MMTQSQNVRLKPSAQYRALLIDALAERAKLFASVMADRGYLVQERCASVGDALNKLSGTQKAKSDASLDLIVFYASGLSNREKDDIRQLTSAFEQPILVITESGDPQVVADAISAGASFCQPLGVNADRLQSGVVGAIEIHKRQRKLLAERDEAVQALAERKLIDRAKSIVMSTRNLEEKEAFSYLQKLSMTRNTPMADIARSIIDAKELLG